MLSKKRICLECFTPVQSEWPVAVHVQQNLLPTTPVRLEKPVRPYPVRSPWEATTSFVAFSPWSVQFGFFYPASHQRIFWRDDNIRTLNLSDDGYAARILKNINMGSSIYSSTDHLSPTSNCVGRLFSMCKRTMSSFPKKMGPESLEGTVLLRLNAWMPTCGFDLPRKSSKRSWAKKLRQSCCS